MRRRGGILVASDLSPRSDLALARAVRLARETRTGLTVVHVVDSDLPRALGERIHSAAEGILRDHLAATPAAAGLKVAVEVVLGRDYEDILRIAEVVGADLIVLGAHRPHALADLFRGSTAERVIRGGHRPVLLVKQRARGPYAKLILGTDFSLSSRRAFEVATWLVPRGEFHLVHAWEPPFQTVLRGPEAQRKFVERHEAQMRRMVERELAATAPFGRISERRLHRILRRGEVRDVLYREVARWHPDLLVIGTEGRTGAAHALLGSVAEDLLCAPPCDILAVKAW